LWFHEPCDVPSWASRAASSSWVYCYPGFKFNQANPANIATPINDMVPEMSRILRDQFPLPALHRMVWFLHNNHPAFLGRHEKEEEVQS
jgi:hypothetical protein